MTMTPQLRAALDDVAKYLRAANREIAQINDPADQPRGFAAAAADLARVIAADSAELAIDLGIVHRALQGMAAPTDSLQELPRAEMAIAALRDRIAQARALAIAAEYPGEEPGVEAPDRMSFARASQAEKLDRLEQAVSAIAEDIAGIKSTQAGETVVNRQQSALVQFFVERAEVKLALIELNLKDVVEVLGLGEAVAGLLRLIRSFAETVMPAAARVAEWLRERVVKLAPKAKAVGAAFSAIVAAIRAAGSGMPPGTVFRDAPFAPEMVVVPAGEFMMGSLKPDGEESEWPRHKVTIAKPFAVGTCAITRGEFAAFMAAKTGHEITGGAHVWNGKQWQHDPTKSWRDPGFKQDDSHPVVCVSWQDAKAYCAWLSVETGKAYRLLSEAEWEYVCRADRGTAYWWGDDVTQAQANYDLNNKGTVPVKSYAVNPFGLWQVHGNVWEWVEDPWHDSYKDNPPSDGSVWENNADDSLRVLRGGSCFISAPILRSARRFRFGPDFRVDLAGFRVARTL